MRSQSTTMLLFAAAVSFGATYGCAPTTTNAGRSGDSFAPAPAVTVTVHNNQWADMRLYVVSGDAHHRLGVVTALTTATFRIPSVMSMPSDLRFVAVPLAHGDSQTSESIAVTAGDGVVFTMNQGLAFASLVARR